MNNTVSPRILPYVYQGIHKSTGEIYFGYREWNVKLNRPSYIDLVVYKTSSKIVNPKFDELEWHIVAECFDGAFAYNLEQQLIWENWNNPLLLNKVCHYNNIKRFKGGAKKGVKKSEEHKNNMRKPKGPQSAIHIANNVAANKGKHSTPKTEEHKRKIGVGNKGKLTGTVHSEERRLKNSMANKGRAKPPFTETHRKNISAAMSTLLKSEERRLNNSLALTGLTKPQVECPHCGKIGGGGSMRRWHFENCKQIR
jgi:hypothetical protein